MILTRLLLFLAAVLPICAQITSGSISGYVFDPAGQPIADANVRASDASRSLERKAITDASGRYRFAELPAAAYVLSASVQNFDPVVIRDLRLTVNSQLRVDFRLQLSAVRQSLQVSAMVESVETETSELGAVFEDAWTERLPLNRRDFLQLALLAPGVLPPVQDSELSTRGSFAMHANGAREEFNNFLLDGVDNNDPYTGRYLLQPSVDAIQEFRISTNSYSAEYGRSAGGQVNVVTRSGTNQWHGFAYEYWRNRALDAHNFFDGSNKPKFIRNQFGLGVGGPARKDSLFCFASMDGLQERRGLSRLATVPTPAERRGNLSDSPAPVVDPFTGAPFPGNRVPSERISPEALRILELFPIPNRPGGSGNYLAQPVGRERQWQSNVRLDYRSTAADQFTLRHSYGHQNIFEPYTEELTDVPGFGDLVGIAGHQAMIHHLRILSPAAVNSLRLGFGRAYREALPENYKTDVGRLWGADWLPRRPPDFGFPLINIAGYSPVGDANQLPIIRTTNTYQVIESLSQVRGDHSVKVGVEIRRIQLNGILDLFTRGSLSFSGALTGLGIGDLLLGLPAFGMQSESDNPQTLRTTALNWYAQDDWKLHRKLTLNLGVRYEYNTPPVDPNDRMAALDLVSGQIFRVGTNGIPRSGIRPDRNNFAPRLGFAWSPRRGLVVRAGYGLYFDAGILVVNSSQYFNPPYFNIHIFFPTPTSLLTLKDPFPAHQGVTAPASPNTLSPDLTTAYMQTWNFNVQTQLGAATTASLAYAGSKGTHLIRSRDLNQPRPGPGDVTQRRPTPAYGSIFFIESGANSSFHSFQAAFDRREARDFSFRVVYTFSKSIDDTSSFLGTKADKNFPQDSRNIRAERGLSSFDMHQRLALAHVYRLPSGSRWLRGTEILGIATVQSGQPFTPILRFDNSNTGNTGGIFGSDRPDLLRNPALSHHSPERWFDTAAFRIPARYTFGSSGRNILRGPGVFSFDVSLVRRFALHEWGKLSLEAETFNLFNRVNLDLPERFSDEPGTFGKIFSAKPSRQVQLALRLTL